MKITELSCKQFAGICDRRVTFEDGINVIYGHNESGKSTLVNLISRILFQKTKLHKTRDREFMEQYFPSAKKGGGSGGDFIDGTVTLETENGTYTLSKEWGEGARATLSTPNGMFRKEEEIEQFLKEVLLYGEGVYTDLLLSSQRNTDVSLQTILDASRATDAKQEITDVVSRAFAESDGLSMDAIEAAIQGKIDEISGSHWDFERGAPKSKAGRWSTGLGQILKAYYALEDAQEILRKISRLEQDAEDAAEAYGEADAAAVAAEEAYNRFYTFAGRLADQAERKKTLDRLKVELSRIGGILTDWPRLTEQLEKAEALRQELADREVLDTWNSIRSIEEEVTPEDETVAGMPLPEPGEFAAVKKAQREISALENKLCGMNLNAAVRLMGDHTMEITSLRTGEPVDVSQGLAAITEAVRVEIPGVMVMQLTPADVDVEAVQRKMEAQRQTVAEIFRKYRVETLEALEEEARRIETARGKMAGVRQRVSGILGSRSMEELTEQHRKLGKVERTAEEIRREIGSLCGGMDIGIFMAQKETVVQGYARDYGSVEKLKAAAFDLHQDRQRAEEALAAGEALPEEYRSITDPTAYLERLRQDWKQKQERREGALTRKTSTATELGAYQENHPEACQETVDRARTVFEETKSLLGHWRHIQEVFFRQKESLHANPMEDLAKRFAYYLGLMTDGKISSEFPEGDKLNLLVYSGNSLLDYGKLSEGTKETVSLAFRLAVLDHLFPNGGGVIVFDDPFTDMDEKRTAQACALLQACAKQHQVIFLTCKEEFRTLLEGNCILFQP